MNGRDMTLLLLTAALAFTLGLAVTALVVYLLAKLNAWLHRRRRQ